MANQRVNEVNDGLAQYPEKTNFGSSRSILFVGVVFLWSVGLFLCGNAVGDRILLKDGSVEVSDKV